MHNAHIFKHILNHYILKIHTLLMILLHENNYKAVSKSYNMPIKIIMHYYYEKHV